MRMILAAALVFGMFAIPSQAEEKAVGHMVYFELKENTPEARKKLVDACYKYLKELDGITYFSAGVRANDFNAPVNTKDWDVALHVVFKDKKAHDAYQVHAKHLKFIEEGKDNWKGVKVYDSYVDASRK